MQNIGIIKINIEKIFIWVLEIISVVIIIPFLTLLERKVLRYIQTRKGPKKVSFLGILQPITDGVKLILKESGKPFRVNFLVFWVRPLLKFFLMLMLFILFSPFFPKFSLNLGIIFYLCVSSILIYTILFSGWGSKSKYSFLGRLRGGAQIISYEISLLTLIFFPSSISKSFCLRKINKNFFFCFFFFFFIFFFFFFFFFIYYFFFLNFDNNSRNKTISFWLCWRRKGTCFRF